MKYKNILFLCFVTSPVLPAAVAVAKYQSPLREELDQLRELIRLEEEAQRDSFGAGAGAQASAESIIKNLADPIVNVNHRITSLENLLKILPADTSLTQFLRIREHLVRLKEEMRLRCKIQDLDAELLLVFQSPEHIKVVDQLDILERDLDRLLNGSKNP